jgi:hypothetical protein
MNSVIGKTLIELKKYSMVLMEQFNPEDPEFKSVLTLPDGAGYMHTRNGLWHKWKFYNKSHHIDYTQLTLLTSILKIMLKKKDASEILTGQLKKNICI